MKIQISSDLLDGLVLALLKRQDYYGYALTQDIQKAIHLSDSTMYTVLRRLNAKHYLETYDEAYQGRNRRYYRITKAGREHLDQIITMWDNFSDSIESIFK